MDTAFTLEPLRHPDMLYALKQGGATCLLDQKDAILISDPKHAYLYADALSATAAKQILTLAETIPYELFLRGAFLQAEVLKHPVYHCEEPYRFHVYMKSVPPISKQTIISHRKLNKDMITTVCKHYSFQNLADPNYISQRIEEGMIGAFSESELVGFIGIHDTGSIGLLEVFPAYRRRGIASGLVIAMIEEQLNRGNLPFGEIHLHNEASQKLARHLGFVSDDTIIVWCTRS